MLKYTKTMLACAALSAAGCANAATFTAEKLDSTSAIISIEGDIVSGDLERFRQISLRYPEAGVILNSDGGLIYPAMEIGKIIKVMGYVTMVGENDVCASACALIWMAGKERGLHASGRLGFHAAYRDESGELIESGSANALIGNYLTSLGASAKTVVFTTTASPDKMSWLTAANKSAAGIEFVEIGNPERPTAEKRVPIVTAIPPPIRSVPRKQLSVLPSTLPAALSQSNSEWVQFAKDAFYDAKSVLMVKDIYGQHAGRKFWVVIDYSADPKSKMIYSMIQYFVYCPNETVSFYNWTDHTKKGQAKVKEVSSRPIPSPPGSAEKGLVALVCR